MFRHIILIAAIFAAACEPAPPAPKLTPIPPPGMAAPAAAPQPAQTGRHTEWSLITPPDPSLKCWETRVTSPFKNRITQVVCIPATAPAVTR